MDLEKLLTTSQKKTLQEVRFIHQNNIGTLAQKGNSTAPTVRNIVNGTGNTKISTITKFLDEIEPVLKAK